MANFTIREANSEDVVVLLEFIKKLAEHEVSLDDVECTPEDLSHSLFTLKSATALLAFEDEEPVGFAVYYFRLSTYKGRSALYLEDVFVRPDKRCKGYGSKIFEHLMNIAIKSDCPIMEWDAINWNSTSTKFCEHMGATAIEELTRYRMDYNQIKEYFNKG